LDIWFGERSEGESVWDRPELCLRLAFTPRTRDVARDMDMKMDRDTDTCWRLASGEWDLFIPFEKESESARERRGI